ncbi:MAG: hypothetical protein F2563_03595 [Actinobacteria bacterium]|nr:hypothetical protein [Actinomycetota bacterium]
MSIVQLQPHEFPLMLAGNPVHPSYEVEPRTEEKKRRFSANRDAVAKELDTVLTLIFQFEHRFYEALCLGNDSYEACYKLFLAEWNGNFNQKLTSLRLKFWKVNPKYFAETYKPIENVNNK